MLEIYLSRCLSAPASRPGLSDNTEPAHRIAPLHCSRAACFAMEWSLLDYFRQEMLVHERLLVRARTGRNRQSEGPSQRVKDSAITMAGLAPLYSRGASKTAPRWQGLPPASVCSTLRCVHFKSHTSLFSQHVKDSATTAGLAPVSVCSTLRCVHSTAHTSLFSRRIKDSATVAGLAPASVCSTLRCVHFKSHTSLFSQHVKDSATTAGLAPCERGSPAQVCARQRLHTLTLPARPKTAPRRQGLPLRAYVPRSGVCTSAPAHRAFRSASEDCATTAGLAPASVPRSCVCTSAVLPGGPHLRAAPDRGCRVPQQSLP